MEAVQPCCANCVYVSFIVQYEFPALRGNKLNNVLLSPIHHQLPLRYQPYGCSHNYHPTINYHGILNFKLARAFCGREILYLESLCCLYDI